MHYRRVVTSPNSHIAEHFYHIADISHSRRYEQPSLVTAPTSAQSPIWPTGLVTAPIWGSAVTRNKFLLTSFPERARTHCIVNPRNWLGITAVPQVNSMTSRRYDHSALILVTSTVSLLRSICLTRTYSNAFPRNIDQYVCVTLTICKQKYIICYITTAM